MNTVELLTAAKARINTPEKWTKGEYAVNSDGEKVAPSDDGACKWCMAGAIFSYAPEFTADASNALYAIRESNDGYQTAVFNDAPTTTHADVMAAFDRAIELAKEES